MNIIKVIELPKYYHINFNGDNIQQFNKYLSIINKVDIIPDFDNGGYFLYDKSQLQQLTDYFIVETFNDIGNTMKLRPYLYQREAIDFAIKNTNSLMILPCGAGKTCLGIGAFIEARKQDLIQGQGLIIVKASLKVQWKAEVNKFSDLTANIIKTFADCNKNEKTFNEQFNDYDLLIANYESLLDNKVLETLIDKKMDFIMCDEVHYVKNCSSKRAKALYKLNNAKIKIGATATPITKDPRDVYGILKFISPDTFGKSSEFNRQYIKYAGYGKINGFKNMDILKNKLRPFLFVKSKEEISDQLPSLQVIQLYVDMTEEQALKTCDIMNELEELNHEDFILRRECKSEEELLKNTRFNEISAKIMALQTFAQELVDSPDLLINSDSKMSKQYAINNTTNPKLELLIEKLDEILSSGEKVCIFSRFERMQEIIANQINKKFKNIKIAYINGSLSANQRYNEAYDKFRDNDNYKVLLCSDAGAEGLNLSKCKYLIEYDLASSYAIQTQRQGRIERADSIHDNVICYQLIANDSWDTIQQKIISKKKDFDSNIIKN